MKITKVEIEIEKTDPYVTFEEVSAFLQEHGFETSEIECEERFDLSISGRPRVRWICPVLSGPDRLRRVDVE